MAEKENNSTPEMFDQWSRIGTRFYSDMPIFGEIRKTTLGVRGARPDDHPISRLSSYLESFATTGQQALYAMEQLEKFSRGESSNVSEFYVRHYFHDFIGRVKTATDLLALTMNCLLTLELPEKRCSLENKGFIRALQGRESDAVLFTELLSMIDVANDEWISAFYGLRNLVIHRAALRFVLMGVSDAGENCIHILAGDMLRVAEEKEVLAQFFSRLGVNSTSRYGTVDPQKLSEEIWNALVKLSEDLMEILRPKIESFSSSHL